MTRKTIAIFGAAGAMGSAIAAGLAKSNYRLLLFAPDPTELTSVVRAVRQETPTADIYCLGCAVDATWEADIIVSTIPLSEQSELAKRIEPFANRKILISISSKEEGYNLVGPTAINATSRLQELFPGTKVVTLFNVPLTNELHGPIVMTGNDKEALQFAEEIVNLAGCNYMEQTNKIVA